MENGNGNPPVEEEKEKCRERKMTAKGAEYQIALLQKETRRRRKNLTGTIGLFEDLLRTKDVTPT